MTEQEKIQIIAEAINTDLNECRKQFANMVNIFGLASEQAQYWAARITGALALLDTLADKGIDLRDGAK